MKIDLPFPHKLLWPNGSAGSRYAVNGQRRKHHEWAYWEARKANPPILKDGAIPIRLTVHAKRFGPLPDADNAVASCKSYLDGIAAAIGVNDKHFAAPTVTFADPRTGRFVIEVGHG